MSIYDTLSEVNVNDFTEKKGQFTYLSWADTLNVLLKHYPEATWDVITDHNGFPYTNTPAGCFVTVAITIEGITRTQVHPVLDHRNQTVKDPNAFQINTSIQRCFSKCVSLFGLALYIYRGEDLPEAPQHRFKKGEREAYIEAINANLDNGDAMGMKEIWSEIGRDGQLKLWEDFTAPQRKAIRVLLDEQNVFRVNER